MSDDLAEEYYRLTHPELWRELDRVWREATEGHSFPSVAELESAWRERVKFHLSAHDPAILSAAGMTLDDLVSVREARVKKRLSGKMLPSGRERVAQRRTALLAIRDADNAGLGWGEAILAVQARTMLEHNSEPDRKTVAAWLQSLHEWGLVSIAPPSERTRGRPRKKE